MIFVKHETENRGGELGFMVQHRGQQWSELIHETENLSCNSSYLITIKYEYYKSYLRTRTNVQWFSYE